MQASGGLIFNFFKGQSSEEPINVFGASVQTGDFLFMLIALLLAIAFMALIGVIVIRKKPIEINNGTITLTKEKLYIGAAIGIIAMITCACICKTNTAYAGENHIDPAVYEKSQVVNAYVDENTGKITVDDWIAVNPDDPSAEGTACISQMSLMANDGFEDFDGNFKIYSNDKVFYEGPIYTTYIAYEYLTIGDVVKIEITGQDPEKAKALIDKEKVFFAKMNVASIDEPKADEQLPVYFHSDDSNVSDVAKKGLTELGWIFDPGTSTYTKNFLYKTNISDITAELETFINSGDITSKIDKNYKFIAWKGPEGITLKRLTSPYYDLTPIWTQNDMAIHGVKISLRGFKLSEKGKQVAEQDKWYYNESENFLYKDGKMGLKLQDRILDIMKVWTPDTVYSEDPNIAFDKWTYANECLYSNMRMWDFIQQDCDIELGYYQITPDQPEEAQEAPAAEEAAKAEEAAEAEAEAAPAAEAEAVEAQAEEAAPAVEDPAQAIEEIAELPLPEVPAALITLLFWFLF